MNYSFILGQTFFLGLRYTLGEFQNAAIGEKNELNLYPHSKSLHFYGRYFLGTHVDRDGGEYVQNIH